MAAAPAKTRAPERTLERAPDGAHAPARERTAFSLTNGELADMLVRHILDVERKSKAQSNRVNNMLNVADDLRKLTMTQAPDEDGWRMITKLQIRGRIYDADDQTRGRATSVRNWLRRDLEALGLIELRVATTPNGKSLGLLFRWCAVPSDAPAGVAQSVRAAES
jgi:hypothetical protein